MRMGAQRREGGSPRASQSAAAGWRPGYPGASPSAGPAEGGAGRDALGRVGRGGEGPHLCPEEEYREVGDEREGHLGVRAARVDEEAVHKGGGGGRTAVRKEHLGDVAAGASGGTGARTRGGLTAPLAVALTSELPYRKQARQRR